MFVNIYLLYFTYILLTYFTCGAILGPGLTRNLMQHHTLIG